jgi:hypothetical protein
MFYELNSFDPAETSPWKRDTAGVLSGTFQGDMPILAQITRLVDPNAELYHDKEDVGVASRKEMRLASKKQGNLTALVPCADIFDYLVLYGYARVFHARINA